MKKFLSVTLSLAMIFSMCTAAFATDSTTSDTAVIDIDDGRL